MDDKEDEIRHYLQVVSPYMDKIPEGTIEYLTYQETLGQVYIKLGRYQEAVDIYRDRLASTGNRSMPTYHYKKWLSRAYAGMNRWKDAYEAMSECYLEADSLSRQDIQKQLTEFSARFDAQQKELEIARLKKEEAERKALVAALIAGLVLLGGCRGVSSYPSEKTETAGRAQPCQTIYRRSGIRTFPASQGTARRNRQ